MHCRIKSRSHMLRLNTYQQLDGRLPAQSTLLTSVLNNSYTKADNSVVVPTDTMKQTTYIMAKQHPINPPELFASILAVHFTDTYKWIHAATVNVIQHRWTRMTVDGKPHPHSFFRDSDETRRAEARATKSEISVHSAIRGLLVLKSTGSAFHGFNDDEYTILQPTEDRILSTDVDCGWTWTPFAGGLDEVKKVAEKGTFDKAWNEAREVTMATFAKDSSASVQNTMYKMCEQILAAEPGVKSVDYALPNKHYFEVGRLFFPILAFHGDGTLLIVSTVDLSWHKGLKNTGKDAEVYAPQSNPNGLIQCTVSR